MKEYVDFYSTLFTAEPVEIPAVEEFFVSLPAAPPVPHQFTTALQAAVTTEEISQAIAQLSRRKAPGPDGITNDFYATFGDELAPRLASLVTEALQTPAMAPASWKEALMCLLYKKGDRRVISNWRPLSLLNSDYKLFSRILVNRLRVWMPTLIHEDQRGFVPGRWIGGTAMDIALVLDSYRKARRDGDLIDPASAIVLLDQEKAYDRVHPVYLERCLRYFGFRVQFRRLLLSLLRNRKIALLFNGQATESFTPRRRPHFPFPLQYLVRIPY